MDQQSNITLLKQLNQFATVLLDANSIDDLLWSIADNLGTLFHFDDCVIYLTKQDKLIQRAAYGIKSKNARIIFKRIEIPMGQGIVGTVAKTGLAEIVSDTRQDPRYIFDQYSGLSELTVPIIYEDKVIGILDSESSETHHFSEMDQELFQIIANMVAPRIASARYQSSLQKNKVKLTLINEELSARMIELEKHQELIIRSEKLASIGQLATGIAHEVNNPLAYSLSNLLSLDEYIGDLRKNLSNAEKLLISKQKVREILDDMGDLTQESIEGLRSAKKITEDLQKYSRDSSPGFELANINDGMRSSLNILRNELKYNINVETQLADLPDIPCHIGKLSQVFTNLILNAVHACEESGKIQITTKLNKNTITIEITDDGTGIPAADLPHIFTPFYTTKAIGEGTGLGLSISYQIVVELHHGTMDVRSDKQGTSFMISIPLNEQLGGSVKI